MLTCLCSWSKPFYGWRKKKRIQPIFFLLSKCSCTEIFSFNLGDFYAFFSSSSIKQCKECRYGYMFDQHRKYKHVDPKIRKIAKCGWFFYENFLSATMFVHFFCPWKVSSISNCCRLCILWNFLLLGLVFEWCFSKNFTIFLYYFVRFSSKKKTKPSPSVFDATYFHLLLLSLVFIIISLYLFQRQSKNSTIFRFSWNCKHSTLQSSAGFAFWNQRIK